MPNDVFANGREIQCKKADGKSICAFPDVCFTPPQTPATPPGVPIPYPNTGFAKDTTAGSKKVMISKKEVMLKNKSHFKKSVGDEAGCAPKKGLITSTNRGKVYFQNWSMNVKVEGKNVVRHLDLTTHNHRCQVGNESIPWPEIDAAALADTHPCKQDKEKEEEACEKYKPNGTKDACADAGLGGQKLTKNVEARNAGYKKLSAWKDDMAKKAEADNDAAKCVRARRCALVPYKPDGCCPAQTADHIIPKASFKGASGWDDYKINQAPCMCTEGTSNVGGSHGLRHSVHKLMGKKAGLKKGDPVDFETELKRSAKSACKATSSAGCNQECIEAQLRNGHKGMGSGDITHQPSGRSMSQADIDSKITDFSSAPSSR